MATMPFPKTIRMKVPKNSAASSGSMSLCDLPKLGNAADFHPLRDEDVACAVEDGAVRLHELAWNKIGPVLGSTRGIRYRGFAEMQDDLIIFVEQGDASLQ